MIRTAFFVLCLGLALPTLAYGQNTVDVDADDRGWYRDDGFHDVVNENYLTGIFDLTGVRSTRNSFFVFDLLDISQVEAATLRVFLPTNGYNSSDSTETFTLFDYSGDVTSLVDGTGGTTAFADLADGDSFGSAELGFADENSFIDIELNAAGVSYLNSSVGDFAAIGGALTSLDPAVGASGNEWVFGETETGLVPAPALLITVPEPSSIAMIGFAFAVATSRRRRSAK